MKSEYYEKTITYLYYILFFILPFVVLPNTSELFEFNKMIFIYTIATAVAGLWMLRSFQENSVILKKTPFDIPLGIFFVSQILSTLFSIDQHTSIFGYYGRFNGGLLSTFTYLFLFYALVSNITTQRTQVIRRIFGISILSSVLVVLWGLPGRFDRDLSCLLFTSKFNNSCWTAQFRPAERMFSTLGQPNWLGAYLGITFFLSLFFILTEERKKMYILGMIGGVSSYLGLLLSRSRSSLASLIPGIVLCALVYAFFILKKKHAVSSIKKTVLLTTMGLLICITLIAKTGIPELDSVLTLSFLKQPPPVSIVNTKPTTPSLEVVGPVTESFDIRKIVWQGAWELGMQYPLFGSGVESFGYAYYSVRPVAHNLTSEWDYLYNKAHNEYLNLLATTGWFGVGSYVLLMLWTVAFCITRINQLQSEENDLLFLFSVAGVFLSIWITNFFGFSITVVQVYWYLMLGFLVMYKNDIPAHHLKHTQLSLSQVGIVLLFVLYLLNSIATYWIADYSYAQSETAIKSNNPGAAANLLQRALTMRKEHVYEDKLSYALAQYAYTKSADKDKTASSQMIEIAEKLNLQSIAESPQNVLYWKTRVKNQYIFYQMSLDKKYLFTGLSALDEAIKLAPTDPKIPYFSATYYTLLYDDERSLTQKALYKDKSIEAIDKTIALKSNFGDAYYLKVQMLRKYGEKEEANKLLEWYIPRFAPSDTELKKELGK